MKLPHRDLPRYTWDQAAILGMFSADAYAALDIKPATIRKWGHDGLVTKVGVGPNGAVLYLREDIIRLANARVPRVA